MANFWDHDLTLGNDERRRLAIACYFGLISFLDDQIGRLIQTLESTGLDKTTRVIYSSDHGDNLGTRGLWNKDVLYRESTGIPLIMAGPDIPKRVCSTNVSLVDLFPTFLEGTGVSPSEEDLSLPQHQSTIQYFENLLRQLLDPEAVDRQAKKDQEILVNRFGGREAALKLGYPGETPTDQKFN